MLKLKGKKNDRTYLINIDREGLALSSDFEEVFLILQKFAGEVPLVGPAGGPNYISKEYLVNPEATYFVCLTIFNNLEVLEGEIPFLPPVPNDVIT